MNNKYFIITIDTEEDNQWNKNQECTTKNVKYLPRFQKLAEKYNYKPVWLTTYAMANDGYFIKYFKEKQDSNLCEIGMHLHAWNNPPEYKINNITNERPYLIEYPIDIMDKKIENLDSLLTKNFGVKPISHRAGRWAMNDTYFKLLEKYNYKVDCSVTPNINWKKCLGMSGIKGINYSNELNIINLKGDIFEIPLTIKKIHSFKVSNIDTFKSFLKEIYFFILGKNQWIRPSNSFDIEGIKNVIDRCNKNNEYIMFMIHSSELMPGGSPNFKNENDIEKLYNNIDEIFKYAKKLGYVGITLRDYYSILKDGDKNGK